MHLRKLAKTCNLAKNKKGEIKMFWQSVIQNVKLSEFP